MSVKVRPYRTWRLGGGYHRPAAERVAAPRAEQGSGLVEVGGAAMGRGSRAASAAARSAPNRRRRCPHLKSSRRGFVDGYARANRQKPSGIAAKETILASHLVPLLGSKRLDAITSEDVQRLKNHLGDRAPKTVNNVLTVLNMLLKKAVEWDVIERMPCTIRLLPIPKPSVGFYDFDEYERLVEAAKVLDPQRVPHRAVGRRGRPSAAAR